VSEFGATRARETALTTRDDLQRVISRSLHEPPDMSPAETATVMLRAKALSVFWATTIARTEVHNAMMFASRAGAKKPSRYNGIIPKKR